jgi:hypothetical protein
MQYYAIVGMTEADWDFAPRTRGNLRLPSMFCPVCGKPEQDAGLRRLPNPSSQGGKTFSGSGRRQLYLQRSLPSWFSS